MRVRMNIGSIDSAYLQYKSQTGADQSAKKLEDSLKSDYSGSSDEELMEVCKEFEAYFLEQVFKEMMKTIPQSEESDSANGRLVEFFKENTIQELAAQSTENNGLGLAQMMYEQMKRNIGTEIPEVEL